MAKTLNEPKSSLRTVKIDANSIVKKDKRHLDLESTIINLFKTSDKSMTFANYAFLESLGTYNIQIYRQMILKNLEEDGLSLKGLYAFFDLAMGKKNFKRLFQNPNALNTLPDAYIEALVHIKKFYVETTSDAKSKGKISFLKVACSFPDMCAYVLLRKVQNEVLNPNEAANMLIRSMWSQSLNFDDDLRRQNKEFQKETWTSYRNTKKVQNDAGRTPERLEFDETIYDQAAQDRIQLIDEPLTADSLIRFFRNESEINSNRASEEDLSVSGRAEVDFMFPVDEHNPEAQSEMMTQENAFHSDDYYESKSEDEDKEASLEEERAASPTTGISTEEY